METNRRKSLRRLDDIWRDSLNISLWLFLKYQYPEVLANFYATLDKSQKAFMKELEQ